MASVKILLVEDEAITALALKRRLEAWGHAATSVQREGRAAMEAFDRDRPDLAILDIFLADSVDGIAVADYIRSRGPVPVVFVTASVDKATHDRALAAAPAAIIQKPYDAALLKRYLDDLAR